jgi:hypothetical protein
MSNKLRIDIALKPHPYNEEPGAHLEAWGNVALYVLSRTEQTKIFETEWDMAKLVEWFTENRVNLCQDVSSIEELRLTALPGESLAQALDRLQARDFADDEKDLEEQWHTRLLEFRKKHSLRFALRGARVPEIIIGYHRNSAEISLFDEANSWCYSFEVDDFCEYLARQLRDMLEAWLRASRNAATERRAQDLLERLRQMA